MMSRQLAQRQQAEKQLLEAMQSAGRNWIGATAMADRLGWPWRIVCRALQRLAEQDAIESKAAEWKSKRSRTRKTTLYRVKGEVSTNLFPSWLSPAVPSHANAPAARVVRLLGENDE